MSMTHWGWLWAAIVVAVGLLDFAVRLGTGWSMVRVVRAEAALFLAASLVLLIPTGAALRLRGGRVRSKWAWPPLLPSEVCAPPSGRWGFPSRGPIFSSASWRW